jgi:hypothetical protein
MNEAVVNEYVALCEQLTAAESALDQSAEERLYARLDQLWYLEMSGEDREAAEARLSATARAEHDGRRREEIDL